MSKPDNKAIARSFIQAWSSKGNQVVDELVDPDIVISYSHSPEPIRGIDNFKEMLNQTLTYFPDLHISIDDLISEGNKVAVRWTYTATHNQDDMFGVMASGKSVHITGITCYQITDGKVVEEVGVVDNLGLMFQLGAVPAPA